MPKLERILSELYPGRETSSLSPEEVIFAKKAIEIANRDAQRSRIPRRDVRIGESFLSKGVSYTCIPRPRFIAASEACSGCAFLKLPCPAAKCSSFDRSDGNNVWFVEEPRG